MGYVRRTANLASVGIVAISLTLTGCGNGSDDGGASGAIRIMNITTLSGTTGSDAPEAAQALEAGVKAINAAGGVNGRELDLIQCDDQGDPNRARECARQAIDEGVVATVGDASGMRPSYIPLLEPAGIPVVGAFPSTPPDFSSKVAFPVVGGVPSLFQGVGRQLEEQGDATKIGAVLTDFPQVSALADLLEEGLVGTSASIEEQALVPIGAPDLQSAVASSTGGGVDGVALLLLVNDNIRYIQQARSSGYTGPIAVADFSSEAIKQLGNDADGVMVTGFFQPLSSDMPAIARYKREMAKYAPDAPLEKLSAINAWVALQVFAHALKDVKSVDRASVMEAMASVEDFDLGGFIPPLTMTTPFDNPNYPRLFNRQVWYEQVEEGQLVLSQSDPVDPFAK